MLYTWLDGTLEITPEGVVLTWAGKLVPSERKRVSPRFIPFTDIVDAVFVPPKGIIPGYVRLILASTDLAAKFQPRTDINTVQIAVTHRSQADTVAEQLRTLIADPSAFTAMYQPPPGAAHPSPPKQTRKDRLVEASSAGGTRPDVAEAAARMHSTLGGGREIRNLHNHLRASETVLRIAKGSYADHVGIVVLTTERLLFFYESWLGDKQLEDFPLNRISSMSVTPGVGVITGSLTVHAARTIEADKRGHYSVRTSHGTEVISGVNSADLRELSTELQQRIGTSVRDRHPAKPSPAARRDAHSGHQDNVLEQIRKLGELHAAGVLTDREFESKKTELLKRL